MRRFLHVFALALVAIAGSSVAAGAAATNQPDPDAPPGAPANWLPQEPWVMSHWLPYDHRVLLEELRVDFEDLRIVIDEFREVSLADVARERGVNPRALMRKLVAPRREKVSREQFELLRSRTKKTFTQPHLGSHMFGHIFHVGTLNGSAERLYGKPTGEVARLHAQGYSYYEIGEMNGRSRPELRRMVFRILRWTMRTGLRAEETPRSWARFWLGYQEERLEHYLGYQSGGGHHHAGFPPLRPLRGAPKVGSCKIHGSRRL